MSRFNFKGKIILTFENIAAGKHCNSSTVETVVHMNCNNFTSFGRYNASHAMQLISQLLKKIRKPKLV